MTISLAMRIELVRIAAETCQGLRAEFIELEHCASAGSEERTLAEFRYLNAERQFGWQWRNVLAILDELTPEHSQEETPRIEGGPHA